MTKVYTKIGDNGFTMTANGKRVEKDSCLIEVNGVIDELMSSIDRVIYGLDILPEEEFCNYCKDLQNRLRYLGGEVSGKEVNSPIDEEDVRVVEEMIDFIEPDVHEFVRFSNPVAMDIDESRVRTRKVERVLTEYLRNSELSEMGYRFINRLSDYFFVLALYIDSKYK